MMRTGDARRLQKGNQQRQKRMAKTAANPRTGKSRRLLSGSLSAGTGALQRGQPEYRAKKRVLSEAEQKFLRVLAPVAKSQGAWGVLCSVRLGDVIEPVGEDHRRGWNRISQKHVDFVVVDENTRPLLCVELQDRSHRRSRRREADQVKRECLQAARVPLVPVEARREYDRGWLESILEQHMVL